MKTKLNFGRLAALTALTGLFVGPAIQKSSAVLDPAGNYTVLKSGNIVTIVNVANNEEITAYTGSNPVGKGVTQHSRVGDYWTFKQNSDGTWAIISLDNNLALDDGNSTANNAPVIQYTAQSGNNNQKWIVEVQSDRTYKITNKASGKVLDSGSKSGNGIPVIQYTSNNGKQQRWQLYNGN